MLRRGRGGWAGLVQSEAVGVDQGDRSPWSSMTPADSRTLAAHARLSPRLPPLSFYLLGALPDQGGELGEDEVDAFQTRVFQLNDLLFHYGLERQVRGEQACPAVRHHGSGHDLMAAGRRGVARRGRVGDGEKGRRWWRWWCVCVLGGLSAHDRWESFEEEKKKMRAKQRKLNKSSLYQTSCRL